MPLPHRIQFPFPCSLGLVACAVLGACVLPTYEVSGSGAAGGATTSAGGTGGTTTGTTDSTATSGGSGGTAGTGGSGGSTGTGTSSNCLSKVCVDWVKGYGETVTTAEALSVTAGPGTIALGGTFAGKVILDGANPLASAGKRDGFFVLVDAAGEHLQDAVFPASNEPQDQSVTAVAHAPDMGAADGATMLGMTFTGSIKLSSGTSISAKGGTDGLVARRVGAAYPWHFAVTSPGDDTIDAISVAPSGDVYVAGTFYDDGTASFGGMVPATKSTNSTEAFVMRVKPDGNVDWVQTFGGSGDDDRVHGVWGDDDGVVVVGHYREAVYTNGMESTSLAGSADLDGYVIGFDGDGNYKWAMGAGGAGVQKIRAVAPGPSGTYHIACRFDDTVTFGNDTIPAAPGNDDTKPELLLAQIPDGGGAMQWKQVFWDVGYDGSLGLAAAPDGGTGVAFSLGTTTVNVGGLDLAVDADTLLLRYDAAHTLLWHQLVKGSGYQRASSAVFDPAGAMIVAGSFDGSLEIGQQGLPQIDSGAHAFLLKIKP